MAPKHSQIEQMHSCDIERIKYYLIKLVLIQLVTRNQTRADLRMFDDSTRLGRLTLPASLEPLALERTDFM